MIILSHKNYDNSLSKIIINYDEVGSEVYEDIEDR